METNLISLMIRVFNCLFLAPISTRASNPRINSAKSQPNVELKESRLEI